MTTTTPSPRYTVRKEMGMWEVLEGSEVVHTTFTEAGANLFAKVWNEGRSRPTTDEINACLSTKEAQP